MTTEENMEICKEIEELKSFLTDYQKGITEGKDMLGEDWPAEKLKDLHDLAIKLGNIIKSIGDS